MISETDPQDCGFAVKPSVLNRHGLVPVPMAESDLLESEKGAKKGEHFPSFPSLMMCPEVDLDFHYI